MGIEGLLVAVNWATLYLVNSGVNEQIYEPCSKKVTCWIALVVLALIYRVRVQNIHKPAVCWGSLTNAIGEVWATLLPPILSAM